MGILDVFSTKRKQPYTQCLKFNARGADNYKESYEKLMIKNPLYDASIDLIMRENRTEKPIPEGYFVQHPVKLVPEPKNEHDSNAIKIMIDNKHVGYVPAELCTEVKNIMKKYKPIGLKAWVTYGNYITVLKDGTVMKDADFPSTRIWIYY